MGQVDTKGENAIILLITKAKGGGESWLLLRRGALNRLSLESATTGKALSVNDMTPSLLTANQNYCLGEGRICLRRRCDFLA